MTHFSNISHKIAFFGAATLATVALPTSVHAHAVLTEPSALAGSYYKGAVRIGHGCEGSATTGVKVYVPSGFEAFKAQPKNGWVIKMKKGKLAEPYQSQGKTVTEDLVELEWVASSKEASLPDGTSDEFAFMTKLPEKAGPVWLRVLQTCEKGQNDWAEIPATGTSTKGMKYPAALLTLKAEGTAGAPAGNANVAVSDAWVRPTVTGQKATGAFLKLVAKENSKLLSVSTPIAGVAEIHEMKMEGNVMKMAPIPFLDLPAGKVVELKPGGFHLMLMDLKSPLEKGAKVPVTLKFQDGKGAKFQMDLTLDATMPSMPAAGAPAAGGHQHHH
jgi:copper(I)-binding protein